MKLLLPETAAAPEWDALSPLEARLRGADAAQACAQTRASLQDLAQRARAAMAGGVAPARYRDLAELLDACQAAQEVVALLAPSSLPDHRWTFERK